MKYLGYLGKAIVWYLCYLVFIFFWMIEQLFLLAFSDSWDSKPYGAKEYRRKTKGHRSKTLSFGVRELRFTLRDGILDSYNAGSQFRIDNNRWVYELGLAGQRIGRIDEERFWRTEDELIVGRFDEEGVLRKHGDGYLEGLLGGQGVFGKELGRLD